MAASESVRILGTIQKVLSEGGFVRELNVWLREGESVHVVGLIVDAHWRDKGLYQIAISTQDGIRKLWIKDSQLQEAPEA